MSLGWSEAPSEQQQCSAADSRAEDGCGNIEKYSVEGLSLIESQLNASLLRRRGEGGRSCDHGHAPELAGHFDFTRRRPRPPMHNTYPSITKFQQFVELKDFRPPTKMEYVRYVRKCAEHFKCDPLTLTQDQLRAYFLFLRQEKHYTRSPMKMAKYALLSFFIECHHVTGWTVFK